MKHQKEYHSALSSHLLRQFRKPPLIELIAGGDLSIYEFRVWVTADRLDQCINEMRHHLNGFLSIRNAVAARIAVKTYIVSWRSLTDAMAVLVNESFDLGIQTQDIALEPILRNRHVQAYNIHEILKRHQKSLETEKYIRLRNQIIHHGYLDDPKLSEAESHLNRIHLLHNLGFPVPREMSKEANIALKLYIHDKHKELSSHLDKTIVLIEEIENVLQSEIDNRKN